jgi:predicted GH43/DUF377 family glycosyl hydrolase
MRRTFINRKQFLTLSIYGIISIVLSSCRLLRGTDAPAAEQVQSETKAGWYKYENNPVLGGDLGVCFDVSVLLERSVYRMWFSWRPKASIALVESKDGIHWSEPVISLEPIPNSSWENLVNRPYVLKKDDDYHMWYTGQTKNSSSIGYATSTDGITWQRESTEPVLAPELSWEGAAIMCPSVLYDENEKLFRMWYSAGEYYEPKAIGYATSQDGMAWKKYPENPIFKPGTLDWEKDRVTGCQVFQDKNWYCMAYIGFQNVKTAQIGLACSQDGIHDWKRHPDNPIILRGGEGDWDMEAVYKPFTIYDGQKWLLWYNGRKGSVEQIGLAFHQGEDLGLEIID